MNVDDIQSRHGAFVHAGAWHGRIVRLADGAEGAVQGKLVTPGLLVVGPLREPGLRLVHPENVVAADQMVTAAGGA